MSSRHILDPWQDVQASPVGAAVYTDRVAAYAQWLPGYRQSAESYMQLPPELRQYIQGRADIYGMDPVEVLRKVPRALWEDPDAIEAFLEQHQISHVYATSTNPELEADPSNWTFESAGPNNVRKANVMTSEEWQTAQEEAHVWASDFTGDQAWWDLNAMWKDFLDLSKVMGYSGAWIAKTMWLEMMQSLRKLWNDLRAAGSFADRVVIARNFGNNVWKGMHKWKNHIAAAFMLGVLCCYFPPAVLFVQIWGLTSVASMALGLLRTGLVKGQQKWRWMRLFKFINRPLARVQKMVRAMADLLSKIKEWIINGTTKVADVIFTASKKVWTKVVQPKVQAIVRKSKSIFAGFISWAGRLIGGNIGPAFA